MATRSRLFGGILLVSGTTIGAAMLALPVATGMAGFLPTAALFFIYWIYMTYTALLMLESTLWMGPESNLITVAKSTLGRWGEFFSWILYLFLLYALTTAYIAGSTPMVEAFFEMLGIHLIDWMLPLPLLGLFMFFLYQGTRAVDHLNRILMIGLTFAFILMMLFLIPEMQGERLLYHDAPFLLLAVSIAATSFGFHIIIPSLCCYFEGDVKQLKQAIWIGGCIPLIVYLVWEAVSLGVIPVEGADGLKFGYQRGASGTELLAQATGNAWMDALATIFAFFAIITSFLGVSLSLCDFLADGIGIQKTPMGRFFLFGLTFIPPLLFTWIDPRAFLSALELAGGYGVVLLLGLLPALIVWSGRYRKGLKGPYRAPGGKPALISVMVISLLVACIQAMQQMGWISRFLNV